MNVLRAPVREYAIIVTTSAALALEFFYPAARPFLLTAALAGALPTAWGAARALQRFRIDIDVFNVFALGISFGVAELKSAAFIVLMLAFARLLDWHTESRATNAVEELLKLKPESAFREKGDTIEEIPADAVRAKDILVAQQGSRIPVDGTVLFGEAFVNEAPVTGESLPVQKSPGDAILGGTLVESGMVKFRAERVGKDSMIERIAELMRQAAANKSRSEKLADRFAALFLPFVGLFGAGVYFVTGDITMTAAIFLVACADDMAVAIPLASTAALGQAARRGIIVKGGARLDALSKVTTLVLDKTGTLTYGALSVRHAKIAPGLRENEFWHLLGIAEKFSEHPAGKAVFREARARGNHTPDPDEVRAYKGSGIAAKYAGREIAAGNEELCRELGITVDEEVRKELAAEREEYGQTVLLVYFDRKFAGMVTVTDVPRAEAKESLVKLQRLGITRIIMFTGDNEAVARRVADALGLRQYRAAMKPEDKLRELEVLLKDGPVAMVGDGVNDAPALARADVGIAMGGGGSAVAVEAADVVILTDDLSRLPEAIELGRRTLSVIKGDIVIWALSNAVGFALVLAGIAGPALAAFYNFATDFFPLLNSARLFRRRG
ncbi:MAG: cation-translocating P-type ATPase [Candidatus Liptonbacteria bacterium]|nr:cation-translocating P-type ATPase [Candidatus Liptonbacteria bacterium]